MTLSDRGHSGSGVLTDIGWLATCRAEGSQADVHPIENAAVAFSDGHIDWVGEADDLPAELRERPTHSAEGRMVIPGLVDCHTHLSSAAGARMSSVDAWPVSPTWTSLRQGEASSAQ